MQKFIKEEICKSVYLMCGYSKGGNLYYCILKEKFKVGNNNDIMFLTRFQFAKFLENNVHSFCVHSCINNIWNVSEYYTDRDNVVEALDFEFPLEEKDND